MNHFRSLWIATSFLAATASIATSAENPKRDPGIAGQKAPTWGTTRWTNLPAGKKTLDVADFKGKVVYLYCFQSWCPGCHRYGFPTLVELEEKFRGREDVAFVAIQTVFEGFTSNPPSMAASTAERYRLKIPFGHSGSEDRPSVLMRNYQTGGTPWTIVIDKSGGVRFNGFHLSPDDGTRIINKLLDERPA